DGRRHETGAGRAPWDELPYFIHFCIPTCYSSASGTSVYLRTTWAIRRARAGVEGGRRPRDSGEPRTRRVAGAQLRGRRQRPPRGRGDSPGDRPAGGPRPAPRSKLGPPSPASPARAQSSRQRQDRQPRPAQAPWAPLRAGSAPGSGALLPRRRPRPAAALARSVVLRAGCCHGAAAAVAASLHAAAGSRAPALRVLLRGGRQRGRRPRRLQPLKARFGLSTAEDITPRFRAACEQQAVTFTLQEDRASLTLSGGPSALDFDLRKVPAPEAASRLQALTLRLADQVCTLKRQLEAVQVTGASPRKSPCLVAPQLFLPDPDPQRGGPGLGTRRRCPGESLINPGFKSKKPAGGVDFESP
uniref:PAXX non-homologous end joining factor n=1 Tax=Ailuropoda melanoleuca TaxID=9646 RepID=A0A7N5KQ65_AILME